MFEIFHHFSLRRRVYENLEPLPHPDFGKRFLDRFIFVIGFLGPLFTLPQVWQIYSYKDAQGVSTVSWTAFFFFSIIWLIYGIVHKEKPLIFSNALWIFFNALIVFGTIIY
ncbi:MAG: SemiSWEET family transporter [bacterium]|nr:SemiSWEET family transporter [bacterium]